MQNSCKTVKSNNHFTSISDNIYFEAFFKDFFFRCCNFHVNNHLDITSIGIIFVLIFESNYKSVKILIFWFLYAKYIKKPSEESF